MLLLKTLAAAAMLAATVGVLSAPPASAQQDPRTYQTREMRGIDLVAVLNAREDTMKGMKRAMSDLAEMVEGDVPYDSVKAQALAAVIERNTRAIPALFPPGSQIRGSDALDEVWEEPEVFAERAEEAHGIAAALVEAATVARGPDDIAAAFKDTALACRACHKDFKKPF